MGVASLVLALLGMVVALVGLVPFLGILNWAALLFLGLAFLFGVIGTATARKKGAAIAGLVLSILFGIVAVLRLGVGGGLL